ncbi:Upc2 protein [Paraphoma chrysanthemicola]|nr:Upc2 protein [Paraphoma chrysanthemicola]
MVKAKQKMPLNRRRRPHRKSRQGCTECKARHIKCDELRPSCANCTISERQCSYSHHSSCSPKPAPAPKLAPDLVQRAAGANRKSRRDCTACKARHIKCGELTPSCADCTTSDRQCSYPHDGSRSPNHASIPEPQPTEETGGKSPYTLGVDTRFTLLHLRCLHHADMHMHDYMALQGSGKPIIEIALAVADTAPFLLDQVLALSALDLSGKEWPENMSYRREASELQIRALSLFNQSTEGISNDNRLALFLFASILGIHVLRETLVHHSHGPIATFIEEFLRYLRLHRGIRNFITEQSWDQILQSELRSLLHLSHLATIVGNQTPGNETSKLKAFLETYDSGSESNNACQDALRWIQWMLDLAKQDPSSESLGIHATMAWPLVISEEYIHALHQHRPEALAVFAYYAHTLYRYRGFWVFGNSGSSLLRLISSSIGSFWLRQLDLPVQDAIHSFTFLNT